MNSTTSAKTKSSDGTVIAFDRLGAGAPIVLVHPAFGHRQFDPPMAELARQLSSQLTVYTYDRRGRGESGDTAPYAVEREIEDLAAVINEAGGSASVYGMSSGAVLALEAAAHGLRIDRLALYEPPFIVDQSRPPYPDDYVSHLSGLIAAGRRGDAVAYAMANSGVPAPVVEHMRGQPFWAAFEAVVHTLVYDGAVMGETQRGRPLPSRFKKVEQPTMVMVASKAPEWAQSAAEALVAALPNGSLRTVDSEFHAVDAQVVAPVVAGFMRR
jgi:pimeloyl-ACP methyl ester carboxylesterase